MVGGNVVGQRVGRREVAKQEVNDMTDIRNINMLFIISLRIINYVKIVRIIMCKAETVKIIALVS